MGITEEHNTGRYNAVKAHCRTCYKILPKSEVDNGLNPIELPLVAIINGIALNHIQHHPGHDVVVYITTKELPIVTDMRERFEGGKKRR